MRDQATQKPRHILTTQQMAGHPRFADIEQKQWKVKQDPTSPFASDAVNSSVKFYIPGKIDHLQSLEDADVKNFTTKNSDAVDDYNQGLNNHFGLFSCEIKSNVKRTANFVALKKSLHFIENPTDQSLAVQTQASTFQISTPSTTTDDPSQLIFFFPGRAKYHWKYVKKSQENTESYYALTAVEFSNSALKELSLNNKPLTVAEITKKIEEALQEETEQGKYDYYQSVAKALTQLKNTISYDADKLASYYLTHFKKILAFLMQTQLPIDAEFITALQTLKGKIKDFDTHFPVGSKENQFVQILLETGVKPLKHFATLDDAEIKNSPNEGLKRALNPTTSINIQNPQYEIFREFTRGNDDSEKVQLNGKNIGKLLDDTFIVQCFQDLKSSFENDQYLQSQFGKESKYPNLAKNIQSEDQNTLQDTAKDELKEFIKKMITTRTTDPGFNQAWSDKWIKALLAKEFKQDEGIIQSIWNNYAATFPGSLFTECLTEIMIDNPTQVPANTPIPRYSVTTGLEKYKDNVHSIGNKVFRTVESDYLEIKVTDSLNFNNSLRTFHIPGSIKITYDLTGKLHNIQASNSALFELFTKHHQDKLSYDYMEGYRTKAVVEELSNQIEHLKKNPYAKDSEKKAIIDQFKNIFEDFKNNLHTSFIKNFNDHKNKFFESFEVPDDDDLKNDISDHLKTIKEFFIVGSQQKHNTEELFLALKKKHDEFMTEFDDKLSSNGLSSKKADVEKFFEIAFIKASQVYTNRSILNIAQNGFNHIKPKMNAADIQKAYSNIVLATELQQNADQFYQQSSNKAFDKTATSNFFVQNFIIPIRQKEPDLDIQRNWWDLPLKNIGMFFITMGTWGLATIGKAIYAGLANLKYRYVDHIKKHVSYTLDSHTQSYMVAHQETKETRRLNKLMDTFVPKKP